MVVLVQAGSCEDRDLLKRQGDEGDWGRGRSGGHEAMMVGGCRCLRGDGVDLINKEDDVVGMMQRG